MTLTRNLEIASINDQRYMEMALGLARWGLGKTSPNPSVGCVLVKDNCVVGRGRTGNGGRPHAEQVAISRAGSKALGATAFITLEPCAHHGETPPCAEAIIASGVSRAVVAIEDPDPRVSGKGINKLEAAGIKVELGICSELANNINLGFFNKIKLGRPFVTLKLATSLDGFIATNTGESKWITSSQCRERSHLLRSENDAVLIGVDTLLSDNPALTVRLPGLENTSPVRVVLDSNLRSPLGYELISSAKNIPTWLMTSKKANGLSNQTLYERAGVELIYLDPGEDGRLPIKDVLSSITKKGVTRLLIEGGGAVAASFIKAGLVDEIYWFRSTIVLGGNGISAISDLGLEGLVSAPKFILKDKMSIVDETLEVYSRKS